MDTGSCFADCVVDKNVNDLHVCPSGLISKIGNDDGDENNSQSEKLLL